MNTDKNINEFLSGFMNFYKNVYIYINTQSLEYNHEKQELNGLLEAKVPAYRAKPVQDKILTNTESMFCVNQISYGILISYSFHENVALAESSKMFLDSLLMRNMNFEYRKMIDVSKPISFSSRLISVSHARKGMTKFDCEIIIGNDRNFVINWQAYLVKDKAHNV